MQITDAGGSEVKVAGLATLGSAAARDQWITEFSDHAPLKFEITGL